MIAIQAAGCAPVARAFDEGAPASRMWEDAHTFASGLRVPKPYGDAIILQIVRASEGTALALTDDQCCVLLSSWDGTSRVYEIATGVELTRLDDHRSTTERTRFSSLASPTRNSTILSGDVNGRVWIWDAP